MRPVLLTAAIVVFLAGAFAPTTAHAERGWRFSDGEWFYYTDINEMRHWYYFDPTPGKWWYYDDGEWAFVSSYRPLQVFVEPSDLRRLPKSFVNSPNFEAAPNRVTPEIDPVVPDVLPDAEALKKDDAGILDDGMGDGDSVLDDDRAAVQQLPRRSGWLRRLLSRRWR